MKILVSIFMTLELMLVFPSEFTMTLELPQQVIWLPFLGVTQSAAGFSASPIACGICVRSPPLPPYQTPKCLSSPKSCKQQVMAG